MFTNFIAKFFISFFFKMSEKRREGSSRDERDMDEPPMSRLFVICNKVHTEQIFLDSFQEFGNIEDIWVVKDKMTSENKGKICLYE